MDGDTGTLSDPLLRAQSQHVDDVGPIVSSLVPVAEQVGGDRVAVRLIVDQNAAEPSAGLRIEHLEQRTEVAVSHGPSPKGSTQPPRPGADRKDEGHQRDEHDRHRDQPFLPDHWPSLARCGHERLRPPIQLADRVPGLGVWRALSGFELAILPNAHSEEPGGLAYPHPPPFTIASEHLWERCHERHPRRS